MSFPKIPEVIDPSAYDAYTYYLERDDKNKLEEALEAHPETSALALKILEGHWKPLFDECDKPRFPLQALRCLKENQISFMTFATCQLFHNTFFHPGNKKVKVEAVSIFTNGRIDRRAKKMIGETMELIFPLLISFGKLRGQILKPSSEKVWTEEQETNFYNILAQLPKSESTFLILPDIPFETQVKMVKKHGDTIFQRVLLNFGLAALQSLTIDNKPMRMIPSSGMMEAFLRVCFPDSTLIPVYRATLSTSEGLFLTLKEGGRDVIQPIEFFRDKIPETIDTVQALPRFNEARIHDFYHQWRAAQTPVVDRTLIVKFCEVLLPLFKSREKPNEFAEFVFEHLVDMENVMYLKTISNPRTRALFFSHWHEIEVARYRDPSMLVWRTLEKRILDAFEIIKYPTQEKTEEVVDEILFKWAYWLKNSEIYKDETYKPMMDQLQKIDTQEEIAAYLNDELMFFTHLKLAFQKIVGLIPM